MDKLKFGVGLWTMGFSADRFIPDGYNEKISFEEQIKLVSQAEDIEAVQIHYPTDFEGLKAKEVKSIIDDHGLKLPAINMNLFGDPIFKYGAFTNTEENIRRKAIDLVKEGIDVAREIGCPHIDMWPGQDGFDYCFQSDYYYLWDSTIEAVKEIVEFAPDLKFSYEYKYKEPRMFELISNVGKALTLVNEVNADNFGITLDYGHALLSRENPAEALSLLNRVGKLFNIHFNDAYGEFDDDLMAGTINFWRTIEFIWYLKQTEYDGYLILDMFPFRENSVEACNTSIKIIQAMERVADRLDSAAIKRLQKSKDITGLFNLLSDQVF